MAIVEHKEVLSALAPYNNKIEYYISQIRYICFQFVVCQYRVLLVSKYFALS